MLLNSCPLKSDCIFTFFINITLKLDKKIISRKDTITQRRKLLIGENKILCQSISLPGDFNI